MASIVPDNKNRAPTAQTAKGYEAKENSTQPDWLDLAQRAFQSSTSYVDTNFRKGWEDSIRAFNNQHPSESKYNQPSFDKRSHLFRPRTRTIMRKNEAAAAAAFFSNNDITNITPNDPNNLTEVASAEIMKQILQYRLTRSIPWFQIVQGGLQDAQKTGVVCAHVYWDYREKTPESIAEDAIAQVHEAMESAQQETEEETMGEDEGPEPENEYPEQESLPKGAIQATDESTLSEDMANVAPVIKQITVITPPQVIKDQPMIDLIPVENIRIDPGASWIDPVESSPYIIHLIPMYAQDVRVRMRSGEWLKASDDDIAAATEITPDTTRLTRNKNKTDPYSSAERDVADYEIVWVQRHIHKHNEEDWHFYTLGDVFMLTEARPLKETVFTGRRPYVIGNCNLETHIPIPSSIPQLSKGLQEEANEIANQRIDNVKFVLNKKYFVRRGKEADVNGLLRNVPGGVVMLDDPDKDVREMNWTDVTASSFEEQKALQAEMDELLGNFNPAALMMAGANNAPAKNMVMLQNNQGTLTEYLIRTYVETFIQPVLRMLMVLEQKYETDQTILALAGKRAELFQRFGIDRVTDELLEKELNLTVNIGMGATDPTQKLNKFLAGIAAYTNVMAKPIPGLNTQEVGKEIFGLLGYADGARFATVDNPMVLQLQQQLQAANQQLQILQQKVRDKSTGHQVSLQKSREGNQTKIQTTLIKEDNENRRAVVNHLRALHESQQMLQNQTRRQ